MKRNTFSKTLILLMMICLLLCPVELKADYKSGIANGAKGALNKFAVLYGKRDIKGIMSLFADDPRIVAVGLCAQKVAVGPEDIRKIFEKDLSLTRGAVKLPFEIISIDNFGNIAWLATNVYPYAVLSNGQLITGTKGRMTAVLKKIKGRWKLFQVHFSIPADQREGGGVCTK